MTTNLEGTLPQYESPPVTEVVCSVLFTPLEELLTPHIGLLWHEFQPDYPYCDDVAPLAPAIEVFGDEPTDERFNLEFTDIPPLPRVWFINNESNGIIQVQRDRFIHNWRKTKPEDSYLRYGEIIKMFEKHLSTFEAYLETSEIGTLEFLQYELSYVNEIPQGTGWTTLDDVGNIFPDFTWKSGPHRFLNSRKNISWRTTFDLPNQLGRLHVVIRHLLREGKHPTLLFELNVRGFSSDRSREGMRSWFDMAHEWVVRGFADLTGEEVQRNVWRRKT